MTRDRIAGLDGLRGIAVVLVIMHNASELELAHQDRLYPEAWLAHVYDHFTQIGWVGVQLFFVLSGFLITRILLESKGSKGNLCGFYRRRVRRIFPLYYLTLVAVLVLLANLPLAPAELVLSQQHQWSLWLFLSNWYQCWGLEVFGMTHFWSLAVEEQFYLVWPFVVSATRKRALLLVSVALCLIALFIRIYLSSKGFKHEVLYELTVCRIDALLCGGIVAILCADGHGRAILSSWSSWLLPIAAVLLLVGAAATKLYQLADYATQTYGYTLLALAIAAIIARLAISAAHGVPQLLRPLDWLALRLFGKYSFAMYVFHYPLDRYLGRPYFEQYMGAQAHQVMPVFLYALSLLAVSFVVGHFSYRFIERRFLETAK
jgi:peptidoglycan/LPS O-acetylase OafA/YrhL